MKQADDIKRIYEQAKIDTLSSADKAVLEKMKEVFLQESKAQPEKAEPYVWRIIMKSPITKLAAAAVIMIAAIIGLNFLGVIGKGGAAWADVIRPIFAAKNAKFEMIIGQEGTGAVITDMVKGSRIHRTLAGLNQTSEIIDLETSKVLTLDTDKKTAVYIDLKNLPQIPNYLEHLRNVISKLENTPGFEVRKLGKKIFDGRETAGFLATCPGVEVTIWADAQTACPVRIEQKENNLTIICKNFQFDIPMDDSLFSMEIPQDYKEQKMSLDLTGSTEEDFIAGLRFLAEMGDGAFPEDVSIEYFVNNAVSIGKKIDALKISDDEKMKEGEKLAKFVTFIRSFNVKNEGQWHYAGSGVKIGDAAKAIFWYKPKDSNNYRVIYGDLSVKEVAPEDLPK
jgi:hypothetical protein